MSAMSQIEEVRIPVKGAGDAYSNESLRDLVCFVLLVFRIISKHAQSHLGCLFGISVGVVKFIGRSVLLVHDNVKVVSQVDVICCLQQLNSVIAVLDSSLASSHCV